MIKKPPKMLREMAQQRGQRLVYAGQSPAGALFSIIPPSSLGKGNWIVFEGDYGGQIYMTVPRKFIAHPERLQEALHVLNKVAWGNSGGASVYATNRRVLWGGMGGGLCIGNTIWLHPELADAQNVEEVTQAVAKVLAILGIPKGVSMVSEG